MNLPVIQSHRYARPTGLGFDPIAYVDGMQRVAMDDYYSNPLRGMSGVGATDQQITAAIGAAASAIPVAGVFIAAAASITVAIETLFSGCGQTCTAATSIVNQVGNQISSAMSTYMNSPTHTTSMQAAYLALFDNAWSLVQQNCGNPALGAAGQRCVSDRQAGACTWKSSPWGWNQNSDGTWTYTWAQAAGSGNVCWNWFNGMRDPIANDPTVVPDASVVLTPDGSGGYTSVPATTGSTTPSATSAASTSTPASPAAVLALAAIGLIILLEAA